MGLGDRSDAVVQALSLRFVRGDLGRGPASAFLRGVLLRKALALARPASRLLVAAASHVSQTIRLRTRALQKPEQEESSRIKQDEKQKQAEVE